MNLKGRALTVHVPEFARRSALAELFGATASAFGVPMPELAPLSADEMLEHYASFTAEQASAALTRSSETWIVERELRAAARAIGSRLRRELRVSSTAEAMAVARATYGVVRIDFAANADGRIRISRCYFSRFYSAAVCELMSAIDQGLVAGLAGGGVLEFRERITEGAACCSATFVEAPR